MLFDRQGMNAVVSLNIRDETHWSTLCGSTRISSCKIQSIRGYRNIACNACRSPLLL